jgi:hypothetical protein
VGRKELACTFWEEVVDFLSIILGVLESRSRGPHPARTISQAKKGEMLSIEALPRNQQLLPNMCTWDWKGIVENGNWRRNGMMEDQWYR